MAKPKPRKRPYIQPPSELSDKERPRTVRTIKGNSRDDRFYTAPNGRKMPIPAQPSLKRSLRQLPLYFIAMAVVVFFTAPAQQHNKLSFALLQALVLCVIFLPMLYWLEKMRFKRYELHLSGGKKQAVETKVNEPDNTGSEPFETVESVESTHTVKVARTKKFSEDDSIEGEEA